jgi:hypothetical protein
MASIPCSPRHSISNIKDVPNLFPNHLVSVASPSATPSLQYFNMRVTQRLHRYRTLKRQWYEVAAAVQNDSPLTSKSVSPLPIPDILPIIQDQPIGRKVNDSPSVKDNSTKTPIQLDPLHSRIQRDLLKLRKLIKARQKKLVEPVSSKLNSTTKSYAEPVSCLNLTLKNFIIEKKRMKKKNQSKNAFLYTYCFSIKFFTFNNRHQ